MVEHVTVNHGVVGSSPTRGASSSMIAVLLAFIVARLVALRPIFPSFSAQGKCILFSGSPTRPILFPLEEVLFADKNLGTDILKGSLLGEKLIPRRAHCNLESLTPNALIEYFNQDLKPE